VKYNRNLPVVFAGRIFYKTFADDSILYAPRRVCGKLCAFFGFIGGQAFYKPDCADGNKVFAVCGRGRIFFAYMGNKPEIMFNKPVFCIHISCRISFQKLFFCCG